MHRIITRAAVLKTLTRFQQYTAATAIVALFVVVRAALDRVLPGYPFLVLLPAVMLVALLFERGTGIFEVVPVPRTVLRLG
ncbi:hypothetical protein [Azospirillum argentinense]